MIVIRKLIEWLKTYSDVLIPSSIYLIIFSLLILLSLDFDLSSLFNGGDTSAILDPSITIQKGLYLWENSVFGRVNINAFIQILYASPLFLLYQLFPSTIAHLIYWILLFSLIPISCYLLTYHLTKKVIISFFIGIFYAFNLFTAIIQHTPVYHIVYLQGITPLLILLMLRIFEKKRMMSWESLLFALCYLPLLRMVNMFILYALAIPFISYLLYTFYKESNVRLWILAKKTIVVFVLIFLLSTPYIITVYTSQTADITQADPNIEFSRNSVNSSTVHATLLHLMRFTTSFGWEKDNFWEETPGIQSFNAAEIYHENPLFIILTFYPILLGLFFIVYVFTKKPVKQKMLIGGMIGCAATFLFLGKMINPPLGQINTFLYDNSSLFLTFFRSAWKYVQIPYLLLLSIVIAVGLTTFFSTTIKKSRKKQLITIVLLVLIQISYIAPAMVTESRLINEGWVISIPNEYYEIADFINNQPENFRILPLPLSKHITGYTPYTWGYAGPDVLYALMDKPIIDKFNNPVLSSRQLELVNHIEDLSHSDLNNLLVEISRLNVKYILIRNDVDTSHRFLKLWSTPEILTQSLENAAGIQSVIKFGDLSLYELEYHPHLAQVSFYQQESQYLSIDNSTFIHVPDNSMFDDIYKINLNLSVYLSDKKDVNESDWKQTNQRIIKTNIFQLSITPKGVIHIFLYNQNNSLESIKVQLDKTDLIEKKIYLQLMIQGQEMIILKDGFIYPNIFSGKLRNEVKFIQIGGEAGVEKMIGNIYDLSLSINNQILLTSEELREIYPNIIRYEYDVPAITNNQPISKQDFNRIKYLRMDSTNINSVKISNTKYKVDLIANSSFLLGFMTSYDPQWQATIYQDGKPIRSLHASPLLSRLNGFWIDHTGELTIEIEYLPQQWFVIGLYVHVLTLTVSIGILLYNWRQPDLSNRKGWIQLKSILKMKK